MMGVLIEISRKNKQCKFLFCQLYCYYHRPLQVYAGLDPVHTSTVVTQLAPHQRSGMSICEESEQYRSTLSAGTQERKTPDQAGCDIENFLLICSC
jgi:hypothetical protein